MSFINWGHESPEQKAIRKRFEEEQAIFEQRAAAVSAAAAASAGGSLRKKQFISVWDTTLAAGQFISLPLSPSGNYNFIVNWGDGNTDTITSYNQAEVTHAYATGGVYTITITGTIEGWSFSLYDFQSAAKLTSITNIGQLKLGNEGGYFQECVNLTTIGGTFDLTGVTSLNNMFANCISLTSVNGISSWNTSAVTDMSGMFIGASSFNQPLNSWDVSSVTSMSSMFQGASFNQPLNSWNTANVTNMSSMFENATAFNQDISGWNTAAVTNMSYMFADATAFNQPLNSWDVSSVTSMDSMFYNATSFNQDISGWDVSAVTILTCMFQDATLFNQDISSWDTSAVLYMNGMFYNATAFNQDISSWNISSVTNISSFMLGKSTADYSYYDNLLNAWSQLTLQTGVTWDMGTIQYTSAGAAARDTFENKPYPNWTINDGGLV